MISGLHTCKPGNEPETGQVKTFTVEQRTGKSGKPWTKIKSAPEMDGGTPYKIMKVAKTDYADQHGNLSFNLEIEPSNGAPAAQEPRGSVAADDPRHHTMRAANLLLLCKNAAKAVLGDACDPEDARSLFIYLSRAGYVAKMPDKPMNDRGSTMVEPEPQPQEEPDDDDSF